MAFIKADISTNWVTYLRFIPPLLLFGGLSLILVALARPQQVSEQAERFSEGIDIVLALDISESMLTNDVLPNRLEAAKKVAQEFIKGRFQDRIGLVVFAGDAFTFCPLTNDYEVLYEYLNETKPILITKPGTAVGNATGVSVNCLRDSKAKSKVIILLSDGDNTAGELDPVMASQLASVYNVKLYTIAVGTITRAVMKKDSLSAPSDVLVDEKLLLQMATITKGQFFRATDAKSLKTIFNQINHMEKVEIKTTKYRDVRDVYHVYLRWAIVLLLGAFFAKITFIGNILED